MSAHGDHKRVEVDQLAIVRQHSALVVLHGDELVEHDPHASLSGQTMDVDRARRLSDKRSAAGEGPVGEVHRRGQERDLDSLGEPVLEGQRRLQAAVPGAGD